MAEIAAEPVLAAEARQVAPILRSLATAGADEESVKRALQPLVLVYGVSDAARTAVFWRTYIKALADLPIESIVGAVEAYTRLPNAEFFPKPGPLRALALKCAEPIYQAASRSWRAAKSTPPPPVYRPSAQQRKAFAEVIMASFGPKKAEGATDEGN